MKKKNQALVVIDMQNGYLNLKNEELRKSIEKLKMEVNKAITYAIMKKIPIIYVRTVHNRDKSTWNQWMLRNDSGRLFSDSEDSKMHPDIIIADNSYEIIKTRHSSFIRTCFDKTLKELKIDSLLLTGYATSKCVGQTAIDAFEYDYETSFVKGAVWGTTNNTHQLMLEYLKKGFDIVEVELYM